MHYRNKIQKNLDVLYQNYVNIKNNFLDYLKQKLAQIYFLSQLSESFPKGYYRLTNLSVWL